MLSYRKKVFFSDLILLLVFLALLFPLVEKTAQKIIRNSLLSTTEDVVSEVQHALDVPTMIATLKEQELWRFFRTSLIDPKGRVLFESHVHSFFPYSADENPEVRSAFETGIGYHEDYSSFFSQTFVYIAKSFPYKGKIYVLRTGFPYRQIQELTKAFEIGFLSFAAFVLLLYGIMTWAIIHRLSEPIQQIVDVMNSYHEGNEDFLPHFEPIDRQGDFGKLASTINSLSDRIKKQIVTLTAERNENTSILESLVEGVIAFDSKFNITFANNKAAEMLGIDHTALLRMNFYGQSAASLLLQRCHALISKCMQTRKMVSDSYKELEGVKRYFTIFVTPRIQKDGAILVLQDRSSEHKMLEMGKDFIANASHELRTPITIIQGFVETLQDLPEVSDEMLKDITTKIARTCNRLSSLVKNLLVLAGLENQPDTHRKKVSLNLLAINCMHTLLAVHPDAKIQIQEREDVVVQADPDLLELAIMNLLENAVKYSNPPAKIEITIAKKENGCISIKDFGIGIPEEEIEHIFTRFFTVDKARSRRSGGAGLGLSIVKSIVQKHKGELHVESIFGKGSCFTLQIPFVVRSEKVML